MADVESRGWGEVERDDDGRIARISFVVPGRPLTWQRARRGKDGPFFTPADRKSKMGEVRDAWLSLGVPHFGQGVFICLGVQAFIGRPPSHYGTGRNAGVLKPSAPIFPGAGKYGGDLDNYLKLIKDALNEVAWHDDTQIQRFLDPTAKWFAPEGELPRTEVVIEPLAAVDLAEVDGQERLIAAA